MPQVLGFVIKSGIDGYESICAEHGLEVTARWKGGPVSGLRRYSWDLFIDHIDGLTAHLRRHGLEPIHFQRRILPVLFQRLYSTRFLRKTMNPANIIKMIDTFAGPFMFRCGYSTYDDLGGGKVRLTISLHPGMKGSTAFFEQCVAGMVAQLEFLGFTSSVVESMKLNDRFVDVTFDLEDATGREPERQELEADSRENFLHWLGEFEESIVSSPVEPSDKILKEAVDHLCAATRPVKKQSAPLRDLLTVISCRLQFAQARGWNGEEGRAQRRLAADRCAEIRNMLV